jgi:cytochrome c553
VKPEKPKYAGMTTNERLHEAGLIDQFDDAAKGRNKEQMIHILRNVELSENDAEAIANTILADPKRYGF